MARLIVKEVAEDGGEGDVLAKHAGDASASIAHIARMRLLVTPTASCGGYQPGSAVMPDPPKLVMRTGPAALPGLATQSGRPAGMPVSASPAHRLCWS